MARTAKVTALMWCSLQAVAHTDALDDDSSDLMMIAHFLSVCRLSILGGELRISSLFFEPSACQEGHLIEVYAYTPMSTPTSDKR
jgi:hypothetical protein